MELETERLYIRNLDETDWPEMKRIFEDFRHSDYAVYDAPLPEKEEEIKALTKSFADSQGFFAVFLQASGKMIGYVCFHQEKDSYDLGYCFHSAYHGHGYAFESGTQLIRYFQEHNGAKTFTAGTALDNLPSCQLLKKLGFVCVSTEIISFDGTFSFQGGNFVLQLTK